MIIFENLRRIETITDGDVKRLEGRAVAIEIEYDEKNKFGIDFATSTGWVVRRLTKDGKKDKRSPGRHVPLQNIVAVYVEVEKLSFKPGDRVEVSDLRVLEGEVLKLNFYSRKCRAWVAVDDNGISWTIEEKNLKKSITKL